MKTICGFCQASCGMSVKVGGGVIKEIRGDPEHPTNQGFLCPKGYASIDFVYSKDRLTHPLIKTSVGFKKISWNEALDVAADRLGELQEKYGPEALTRFSGAPTDYECRDGFLQFLASYESPNAAGKGHLCAVTNITAKGSVFGNVPEPDYRDAKHIIFWGANPVNLCRVGLFSVDPDLTDFRSPIPEARRRGIRVTDVLIFPGCSA